MRIGVSNHALFATDPTQTLNRSQLELTGILDAKKWKAWYYEKVIVIVVAARAQTAAMSAHDFRLAAATQAARTRVAKFYLTVISAVRKHKWCVSQVMRRGTRSYRVTSEPRNVDKERRGTNECKLLIIILIMNINKLLNLLKLKIENLLLKLKIKNIHHHRHLLRDQQKPY